jgi:hypothetical protein
MRHEWMRTLRDWLRGARWGGRASAVRLAQDEVWGVHLPPGEPVELTCHEGLLWLTREGDSRDFVLRPGDRVQLGSPGHVVVQALRPARLLLARESSGVARGARPYRPEARAS